MWSVITSIRNTIIGSTIDTTPWHGAGEQEQLQGAHVMNIGHGADRESMESAPISADHAGTMGCATLVFIALFLLMQM